MASRSLRVAGVLGEGGEQHFRSGPDGWGDGILPQGSRPKPEGTKPKPSQKQTAVTKVLDVRPWAGRTGEAAPRLPRLAALGGSPGCRREGTEPRVWGDRDSWKGHGENPEVGGVTAEARGRTAQRDERAACCTQSGARTDVPAGRRVAASHTARTRPCPGSRHLKDPQQSSCPKERTPGLSMALQRYPTAPCHVDRR